MLRDREGSILRDMVEVVVVSGVTLSGLFSPHSSLLTPLPLLPPLPSSPSSPLFPLFSRLSQAAESLVEESKTQWATLDQDGRRDDITVMVVEFMWDKADDATKAWLDETTKDLKSTYRWPITEQSPHGPLKS